MKIWKVLFEPFAPIYNYFKFLFLNSAFFIKKIINPFLRRFKVFRYCRWFIHRLFIFVGRRISRSIRRFAIWYWKVFYTMYATDDEHNRFLYGLLWDFLTDIMKIGLICLLFLFIYLYWKFLKFLFKELAKNLLIMYKLHKLDQYKMVNFIVSYLVRVYKYISYINYLYEYLKYFISFTLFVLFIYYTN